ncbi:glycoside hydrolase family 16 protein [Melanomma pulvis-pyrius CBS 109.77]|uniref:Glycoside hydrolase family 16 protein n=1 Tax=Melanomma pulvis-pyrius CBS 109.77 TaxID=1314802 RepID=A0A6A6X990_9PLEO|nr:glycoside hydrolase family 16 protein [Melanomma pulvis-pyrius CBS 109.77]
MSAQFNKLFEKGKAKVKEYAGSSHPPHQGQGQGQGYPGQGYPSQQQYSGSPYPPQPYPPSPYGAPPYQQPQYPPPNQQQQWGPPPNQWAPPPPQQAFALPPIPQHSKPTSPQPPPIPTNRPLSNPPPPQNQPPAQTDKVYWKPSFDASTPVNHNFRHELGAHGWGNNEAQNYVDAPANSFHHDNRLIVRALAQNGTHTSARLTSHQTLSRPRGFLTVTVLPPCAEGIWPAFWLLPKDPFQWPTDGEVDIFESWNGDCVNHSCLHWGNYNGEDWNKHRVIETHLPNMSQQPHTFGFAWIEEEGIPEWRGRMIWYIDGQPKMKGNIPLGTRRMEDFRILINVAMGGNVCQGKLPKDGYFDFVVSDLKMCEEPAGGWPEFERTWGSTPEGKTM